MYIMTIFHDEIVPLPLSKFRETFNNTNRIMEKSHSKRTKWAKENGKHYIYFHGRSGSGKGHTFRPVGSRKVDVILL